MTGRCWAWLCPGHRTQPGTAQPKTKLLAINSLCVLEVLLPGLGCAGLGWMTWAQPSPAPPSHVAKPEQNKFCLGFATWLGAEESAEAKCS